LNGFFGKAFAIITYFQRKLTIFLDEQNMGFHRLGMFNNVIDQFLTVRAALGAFNL
jgi:hypothetical protein